MKIAIVGAGWAGLAAAVRLHRAACQVHVYEAAAQAGGRARPVELPGAGLPIDNGQHILLGAYHDTLALMKSLGVDLKQACHVQPLGLRAADDSLHLRFWPLPAPAHRLGALFASHGLAGWRGRLHLLRLMGKLDPQDIAADMTVTAWLTGLGCPSPLMRRLWEPLCLAAMNTQADQAQARLFARVLRDSLGAGSADSQIYIPRGRLHDLWPANACALLGDGLRRQRVRSIMPAADGRWRVDGQTYDRVILAVPVDAARRLLQPLPNAEAYLARWPHLAQSAIGTLTLRLSRPWQSGRAMSLLWDDPAQGAWGQWLFDRSASALAPAEHRLVHVVISAADRYAGQDAALIATSIIAQVRAQARTPLPDIVDHWLITEKRATFDALPGLQRPLCASPWNGLALAGDWTDTGYPAVLEGAVRSGLKAADQTLLGRP